MPKTPTTIPAVFVSGPTLAAWFDMPIRTVKDILGRAGIRATTAGHDFVRCSRALIQYWRQKASDTNDRGALARARKQEAEAEAAEIQTRREISLYVLRSDVQPLWDAGFIGIRKTIEAATYLPLESRRRLIEEMNRVKIEQPV